MDLPCTVPPVRLELPDLIFNRETLIQPQQRTQPYSPFLRSNVHNRCPSAVLINFTPLGRSIYSSMGVGIQERIGCVVDLVNVHFALSVVLPKRLPRKKQSFCRLVLQQTGVLQNGCTARVPPHGQMYRLTLPMKGWVWVPALSYYLCGWNHCSSLEGEINGSRIKFLGMYPKYIVNIQVTSQ